MGSFNTTCFASGQTIAPGDRAFIMPILQASGDDAVEMAYGGKQYSLYGIANSTCYPHAFWEPYGGFLEGTYDDYGEFELVDTPINRARLLQFIADLVKKSAVVREGENECHDIPVILAYYVEEQTPLVHAALAGSHQAALDRHAGSTALLHEMKGAWNYAREAACEHRLFAVNYQGEVRPLQFSVMHGVAFDGLTARYASYKRECFDNALDAIQGQPGPEALAQVSDPELLEALTYMRSMKFMRHFERLGRFEGLSYPGEAAAIEEALDAYGAGRLDAEGLFAALEPLLDARCVIQGLDNLNLKFSPQVYAGQDYRNEIGRGYAAFVQATSEGVSKIRRDRYGDDDD
jgi:hypothetical protein